MKSLISIMALLVGLLPISASAMLKTIVVDSSVAIPAYTGPGDITSYTVWYGFRAYNAAKATANANVADLIRVSDNATCTLKLKTNGDADVATGTICNGNTQTVTTWIGASTAMVTKLYDQTAGNACGGASCDLTDGGVAGRRPTFVLNCNGSLPCMRSPGGGSTGVFLTSANNYTPNASADISLSLVANRSSGTQNSSPAIGVGPTNGSRWEIVSGNWRLGGVSNVLSQAQANGWHAANGVIDNGGTDTSNIDGTEVTASALAGSTAAQTPQISLSGAFATINMNWAEGGWQDNTLWNGTMRTNLCHNERLYWSTPGSC